MLTSSTGWAQVVLVRSSESTTALTSGDAAGGPGAGWVGGVVPVEGGALTAGCSGGGAAAAAAANVAAWATASTLAARSEEHTSELQSRLHLVCRLLLEKKKK